MGTAEAMVRERSRAGMGRGVGENGKMGIGGRRRAPPPTRAGPVVNQVKPTPLVEVCPGVLCDPPDGAMLPRGRLRRVLKAPRADLTVNQVLRKFWVTPSTPP
jgi:hypothetical protein